MRILILLLFFSTASIADVDLVLVDKSERIMTLMDGDKVIKTYSIALGGEPKGHKQKEGDQKTPEGTYVLDYIKNDSSFYRSMHISYPNAQDKANAKKNGYSPGGFIMVHGQKNGFGWLAWATQFFDWTDGCIAITNSEMDEFLSFVKVGTKINIEW